jgi:hypothetical protein
VETEKAMAVLSIFKQALMISFFVLFTTSFVQDGHGMLPLLSYSIKDSFLIKALNLVFGLAAGGGLLALGL